MNFLLEENFKNEGLCALYFYTQWLIYHKKMLTMFDKLKYKDINYFAIDALQHKKLVNIYNVNSVPTVILLNSGKEIDRIEGVCLTSAFKAFFDDIYKKVNKLEKKDG